MRDGSTKLTKGEGEERGVRVGDKGLGEGRFFRSSSFSPPRKLPKQDAPSMAHAAHPPDPELKPCPGGYVPTFDPETLIYKAIPTWCHKWACPRCRLRKQWALQEKAEAGNPDRHIVLTVEAGSRLPLDVQVSVFHNNVRRLFRLIRRVWGPFEYMAQWELTKKGTPHLHILQRGCFIDYKWLSKAWFEISGSKIVWISKVRSARGAARELTKYATKTAADTQDALRGKRISTMSRGWLPDDFHKEDPSHLPDPYAAFFEVSLKELSLAMEIIGASPTQPIGKSPMVSWHLPRPPPLSLLDAIPTELPDRLAKLLHYLVRRAQPGFASDRHSQETLALRLGVRAPAWSGLHAMGGSYPLWEQSFDPAPLA